MGIGRFPALGLYEVSWLSHRMVVGLTVAALIASARQWAYAQDPTTSPLHSLADTERIERLRAHGIAPVHATLAHFLEHGFAPGTRLTDLPSTPPQKSQIVIDAIVESTRQRVAQTVPTLVRLARGIAPEGIRTIIQWDVGQRRPRDREVTRILQTLRLNAIVALGLIGDPERAYELVFVFDREKDPELRTACALALATVGSPAGLPYLVREVRRANRTTSVAAAEALRFITGLDYGPGPDDPIAQRRASAKAWKNWWKHEGETFRPRRDRILIRRLTPPVQPLARPPQTVRELVDRIAYPADPRWTIDAYDARERLRLVGTAALDGLEKIIADKNENLEIRRQAIVIYTQMATAGSSARPLATRQPRRAYKMLKRFRWSWQERNPEIREVIRQCLRRLRGEE